MKKRIITILVLSLLAVASALFINMSGGKYPTPENSITLFQEENTVAVAFGSKPKLSAEGILSGDPLVKPAYTPDGNSAAFITDYMPETGGVLWYVNASGIKQVAMGVISFRMAASGASLAYNTAGTDETAPLFIFNAKQAQSTLAAEHAAPHDYCLSPDGKIVGYRSASDTLGHFTGFVKQEGRPEREIGDDRLPVAIANGGKMMYLLTYAAGQPLSLSVQKNNVNIDLLSEANNTMMLFFNKDATQLVFSFDGKTYISRDGGEKTLFLDGETAGIVLPKYARAYTYDLGVTVSIYETDRFTESVFETTEGLAYVNAQYEPALLTEPGYANALLNTKDQTVLYLTQENRLLRVSTREKTATALAEGVRCYAVSDAGRFVYYVDQNNELFFIKDNGQPEAIASPIQSDIVVLSSTCFYITDGLLYSVNGGEVPEKIESAGTVHKAWTTPSNVFCLMEKEMPDGVYEVYRGSGGLYLYFCEETRR